MDEIILERDDPAAAAKSRSRLSGRGRGNERDKPAILKDGGEDRDKAYEREYIAHDRKRLRRD